MTSKAHSSGSDFVGNPGMCAVKVNVFGVVFQGDVGNRPQHSCVDSNYINDNQTSSKKLDFFLFANDKNLPFADENF